MNGVGQGQWQPRADAQEAREGVVPSSISVVRSSQEQCGQYEQYEHHGQHVSPPHPSRGQRPAGLVLGNGGDGGGGRIFDDGVRSAFAAPTSYYASQHQPLHVRAAAAAAANAKAPSVAASSVVSAGKVALKKILQRGNSSGAPMQAEQHEYYEDGTEGAKRMWRNRHAALHKNRRQHNSISQSDLHHPSDELPNQHHNASPNRLHNTNPHRTNQHIQQHRRHSEEHKEHEPHHEPKPNKDDTLHEHHPQSAAAFARDAPKAGHLQKLGKNIPQFKRRFFVLKPTTYLYYFLSPYDESPRGCIDLEGDNATISDLESFPDGRCRFAIVLHPKNKTAGGSRRSEHAQEASNRGDDENATTRIMLEARNQEVAEEWKQALQTQRLSYVRQQQDALQRTVAECRQVISNLEARLEECRLVEQDRDGAVQDAKEWRQKYERLNDAIGFLTRAVLLRGRDGALSCEEGKHGRVVEDGDTAGSCVQSGLQSYNKQEHVKLEGSTSCNSLSADVIDESRSATDGSVFSRPTERRNSAVSLSSRDHALRGDESSVGSQSACRNSANDVADTMPSTNEVGVSVIEEEDSDTASMIVHHNDEENDENIPPRLIRDKSEGLDSMHSNERDHALASEKPDATTGTSVATTLTTTTAHNHYDQTIADALLTKDQQQLDKLADDLAGTNFSALSNACHMLQQNLSLTSQEANAALEEVHQVNAKAEDLQVKLTESEGLVNKLWEENGALRQTVQKQKKERKVLVKELRAQMAFRMQWEQQQQLEKTQEQQQKKGGRRRWRGRKAAPTSPVRPGPTLLGTAEKRLILELEEDIVSTLKLHEEFLVANRKCKPTDVRSFPGCSSQWEGSSSCAASSLAATTTCATDDGNMYCSRYAGNDFCGKDQKYVESNDDAPTADLDTIRTKSSLFQDEDDDEDGKERLTVPNSALSQSPIQPRRILLVENVHDMECATSDVSSSCAGGPPSSLGPGGGTVCSAEMTKQLGHRTTEESHDSTSSGSRNKGAASRSSASVASFTSNSLRSDRSRRSRPTGVAGPPSFQLESEDNMRRSHVRHQSSTSSSFSSVSLSRGGLAPPPPQPLPPSMITENGHATSLIHCPIGADRAESTVESGHGLSGTMTEHPGEDGQIYHLTFHSRKIGIQFQKVPAPSPPSGKLTAAIAMDAHGETGHGSAASELRSIAAIARRATGRSTDDDDHHHYVGSCAEEDASCQVPSPVDAVLVCGFHGFDDAANRQRPKLGARLVAFDGISVEVGRWTFESVRKSIQARGRPISLSFRNDFLNPDQRLILSRAVVDVGAAAPLRSNNRTPGSGGHPPYVPTLSSLGKSSVFAGQNFYSLSQASAPSSSHSSVPTEEEAFSDVHLQSGSMGYPGESSFSTPNKNYRASFSEAGASTSILSSAVAPLVAGLLSGLAKGDTRCDRSAPPYLRGEARSSLDQMSHHHNFKAGLL